MARLSRIPKSAKRFSDQDARENKVASRKVRSGFRTKMRDKTSRIPKSAKRFSDQDARENKSHPEKCEAVFGPGCARKQSGIPKNAKRFSDQDACEARRLCMAAMFRLSLVFLNRFQFGNEISLTGGPLSSLVKNKLITRPAKGRSTGTLLKMGNCACVLSLLR